mmetsp:Transcript_23542/g.36309  ORF Transcript_23542/g.36309 Transcript_23542/m.36309 type:complete len:113 (-) Transcript_23542:311-649(-)
MTNENLASSPCNSPFVGCLPTLGGLVALNFPSAPPLAALLLLSQPVSGIPVHLCLRYNNIGGLSRFWNNADLLSTGWTSLICGYMYPWSFGWIFSIYKNTNRELTWKLGYRL